MKYDIKELGNYGTDIHRYLIKKDKNIHGAFCNLFSELGLSEDSISEVDITFDNMDNEYLYIENKGFEFHFFVTLNYITLIIKTTMDQQKLNDIMKKFFYFQM